MDRDPYNPFDFDQWRIAIMAWALTLIAVVILYNATNGCRRALGSEPDGLDLRPRAETPDIPVPEETADRAVLWVTPDCSYCDKQLKVCSQLAWGEGYMVLVGNSVEHAPAVKSWQVKTFPTIQIFRGNQEIHRAVGFLDLKNTRDFFGTAGLIPNKSKVAEFHAELARQNVAPAKVFYGAGSSQERQYAGSSWQTGQVAGISQDQQQTFQKQWSNYYGGQQGYGGGGVWGSIPQYSAGAMGSGRSCQGRGG